MFFSVYRFQGEPAALQAGHARMLAMIPPGSISLHLSVPRPDGLDVYDACGDRATFEAFSGSDDFRGMLAAAGLPAPRIETLGDVAVALAGGQRLAG